MSARRLIVIGAGPAGLAAALSATKRGWDVTVLERDEIGASLRRWGPTRFFSPLAMNLPPGTATSLANDTTLTGPEFVDSILLPIAPRCGHIRTGHKVVAVGRAGLTRSDFPNHPIRHERPFRLLVETPTGEQTFEAEAVIDASGTYGQPVSLGVPGERAAKAIRDLGALHTNLPRLQGKTVLLIGHGDSAAHALLHLATNETQVIWATRSFNQRPFVEVASDPLPERRELMTQANQLAQKPPPWLKIERRATVECVNGPKVTLSRNREVIVDEIIALTGYRPDLSFLSELALEIAPATEGSARLARALSNVTDCLSVPSLTPADLDSGEPGFHLAGAKSYGRARTFLLKNGYAQIETILDRLECVQA